MAKSVERPGRIRKKRKFKCPNPLFEEWLKEWRDSAASKGLSSRFNFSKALSSLKKYPLPLATGKEAKILENFGDKICKMLDERLQQHKAALLSDSGPSSSSSLGVVVPMVSKGTAESRTVPAVKRQTTKSTEIKAMPIVSTALPSSRLPVALPIAAPLEMSEAELLQESESSFSLKPGQFDIFLCVDHCETLSGQGKSKKAFLDEIKKSGVDFIVRKLHVGDFLWIAKEQCNSSSNHELVLDFVIERKRLDDLAKSIKDGRFREQKFRLKSCGLRRPIYLVEHCRQYLGIPESTLEQAIVNTQVVDGFTVQRTRDIKESVSYLSLMTRHIQKIFQNQILKSGSRQVVERSPSSSNVFLAFHDFNRGSMKNKNLTIREMFVKHLLQFHGLSVDRAAALVDRFETPAKLLQCLNECQSENERTKMLAEIRFGKNQRPIGPALGKVLQHYYCSSTF